MKQHWILNIPFTSVLRIWEIQVKWLKSFDLEVLRIIYFADIRCHFKPLLQQLSKMSLPFYLYIKQSWKLKKISREQPSEARCFTLRKVCFVLFVMIWLVLSPHSRSLSSRFELICFWTVSILQSIHFPFLNSSNSKFRMAELKYDSCQEVVSEMDKYRITFA